ncbi:MAG: 3-octaprenyl-4-hydroxybenzoate decarboxylase [Lysobacteraceae bacterium SCN 69-123]|jgi:4-hydroxy-3-polyprenylbenzoate decarboxylase|uniref:UbiD family decarboxylase n=1 Tax=Stenotrophomonas acidaminiphila TaxID=128780 RepID=UPI00086A3556|nr:UbiD family decarboxylase [Stenotrophomonas acidaminiphila]MBN8803330.1 UbiD family decarboxylase [Stenotrophomonas acidaminiphila]MDF9441705.1 UbiD family decarboxylase [Stenotrophomonas acidaminiphila]ODU42237.1 MAG: 3-octaprenyl-4-hydroxybenzoate decarboxylase [Xanthomonadaceae bacterium SCN 69-123]OJY78763.1 MAG: 3-octaprenyl-4-hydroxybenzoate decarboxylase [Stenotrophomonas sp. 69-14]
MAFHDLRGFLQHLGACGQLRELGVPVDPELESTALCLRALRAQGPALLMPATGSAHPLLGNLFGHSRRIELALAGRPLASLRELGELLAAVKEPRWPGNLRQALAHWPELAQLAHVAPRRVDEAAFDADVRSGEDVDLGVLPVQRCWPQDAGKLITFGLVVTRGTRQPRQNVAIYRQQVIGRNRVIMRWLPHRGGALDFADWQAAHPGRPFPVLVAIGADPATLLAAVAPVPDTLSEYEFAGLLRASRTRLWRSALTGLDAPAGAEILLEGFIHPGDTALEGPFGDHTGYYNAQDTFPVFTVERMRMRTGAIYHGSYMGRAPYDEPSVLSMALNDVFVPILRKVFPEIVDFYLPPAACSYRIAVVSIRKQYAGHARRIMMGIWSYLRQFTYTKFVIVTDDDIDVRDWSQVVWAISTRVDPARDSMLVENTPIDYLDFSSPTPNLGSKLGLDATHKWPAETSRTWSQPIQPDPEVERRVDALWRAVIAH